VDFDSSILYRTHFQPSTSVDKDVPKIDLSNGSIINHKDLWLGFDGCVQSVIADQSVACSGTEVVRFDDMFSG
jgi:hypothetical protein